MVSPAREALARLDIRLRPQMQADLAFVHRLYLTLRWDELAFTGWPDEAKTAFLEQQSTFQQRHYAQAYAEGTFAIVEAGGQPIGRLYLFQSPDDTRIVDIGLLPGWRGRGIGSALIGSVADAAAAAGRRTSIHVEQSNPARRLYRRLGFEEVAEREPYLLMIRRPGARAAPG